MLAVVDHRAPEAIIRGLLGCGFDILKMPSHPDLPHPVAAHPDMLLFFARDRILCTQVYAQIAKKELEILSKATSKPMVCVEEAVSAQYPSDILLNAAVVGNTLICRTDHTAKALLADTEYTVCNTRQGYAKCSTLPIGDRALITADPSIARVARENAFDVLKVEESPIEILQYDNGFIGGASSYAPYTELRELYFCGDWKSHRNANEIEEFCHKHKRIPIALADRPLVDLGTVFLI